MTMHRISNKCAMIALLILGSATLLFSCKEDPAPTNYDLETLMTESSENRTISMFENGKCNYVFTAPLIEGYSLATNPYQEFRRGINLVTFRQDTIRVVPDTTFVATQVHATITANYAIYYEKQDLWEAKGDVVVIKNERNSGDTLVKGTTQVYTQQLYWNAKIGRIYSNVDTRVLTADGPQFGEGFDTDQALEEIHFRKYLGEVEFDFTPVERDTVEVDTPVDAPKDVPRREPANNPKPVNTNRQAPPAQPKPTPSFGGSSKAEVPSFGGSHKAEVPSFGGSHKAEVPSFGGNQGGLNSGTLSTEARVDMNMKK